MSVKTKALKQQKKAVKITRKEKAYAWIARTGSIITQSHWNSVDFFTGTFRRSPQFRGHCTENPFGTRPYSYRPAPIFHGDGPLYMGLELETSCARSGRYSDDQSSSVSQFLEKANASCTSEPSVYAKEDGSISGAEYVFHPRSLASWQHYLKGTYSKAREIFTQYAVKGAVEEGGHESRGIHIHMSKAAFTNTHLVKFCRLIYGSKNLVATVAQRTLAQMNRWASLRNLPRCKRTQRLRAMRKQSMTTNRYSAVNVTTYTVEIRVFNSNLLPERIQSRLEFCQAAYDFSRTAAPEMMHWRRFLKHIKNNAQAYPALHAFLAERQAFGRL